MGEAFTVRQAGGSITLHLPDKRLEVVPWDMEGREVCCLPQAMFVLNLAAERQRTQQRKKREAADVSG